MKNVILLCLLAALFFLFGAWLVGSWETVRYTGMMLCLVTGIACIIAAFVELDRL